MKTSSALKSMCHLEHLLCIQSMLQPQAKWVAFAAKAGCSLYWLQRPTPPTQLCSCIGATSFASLPLFPFCEADQLLFFWLYTFFTCVNTFVWVNTALIRLYSCLVIKPFCLFKMAFADLCSNGLIICWLYNLIPSGQPLFSGRFMITYTSQIQMINILLQQKKHVNSEEENFSSSYFSWD